MAVTPTDVTEISQQLVSGGCSSSALTQQYLDAIAAGNERLGAFTFVASEEALRGAAESDSRRARGATLGPLDGIPVAIKANIAVRNWPYTAGLGFRRAEIAAQDAFLIGKLRAAGAVLLGLTNMDEGALGAEGANPWYRTTENPLRPGYCAGGSSCGSAAAVAANWCAFAIGTDTIGSVRIPSAFCGTVALKPSYGLISIGGIVPVALRFDHAGPMTRTVRDLSLVLPELAGYDNACAVSTAPATVAAWDARDSRRIAYGVGFSELLVSDAVIGAYNQGIAALRSLGHDLQPLDLQRFDLPRLRRAILVLCELDMWRSHRSRLNNSPDDFSPGLRAFIRYGSKLSGDEIAAAETRIARFFDAWQETIGHFEAVVLPTVACASFPLGERRPQNTADLTAIASATGQPALTMPLPRAHGELPAGLQLLGHNGHDLNLVSLAARVAPLLS